MNNLILKLRKQAILKKRKEIEKKRREMLKKRKEQLLINKYKRTKEFKKIKVDKLEPVVAVNDILLFLTTKMRFIISKHVNNRKFLMRILTKRINNFDGQLDNSTKWCKNQLKKDVEEIKELLNLLKGNKKVLDEKSVEELNKSKKDVENLKEGVKLKIKYMYKKARGENFKIPFVDQAKIKNSKMLVLTYDPDSVRKAPLKAFKIAKEVMKRDNKPTGTKARINTNVNLGANTSSNFGRKLDIKLEKFSNTKSKINFIFIIIILFFVFSYFNKFENK